MMDLAGSGAAGALDLGDAGGGGGAGAGAGGGGAGAGGGDTAAAAAAAKAGEGGGESAGADPDWYTTLNGQAGEGETASHRDWVKSKGFKDLDGLVKSARDTEKSLRESGRIKVPGEGATAEDVSAFHKAIGVPDDPTGYEVKLPENAEGLELKTALLDRLAAKAHALGAPKGVFEGIAGEYIEAVIAEHLDQVSAQDAQRDAKFKEWGALKDEKLADCSAAARALGLTRADIASMQSALGSGRLFDVLSKIGSGMAEDTLVQGGRARFTQSKAELQGRIDGMKKDADIVAKIAIAGTPERVQYDRLVDELARVTAAEAAAT
jgi:hypothetical protein